MSDKRKGGGAAFPHAAFSTPAENGMSLRDYMAAKAMHGIMSHWPEFIGVAGGEAHSDFDSRASHMARRAFQMADAMLKAREQ